MSVETFDGAAGAIIESLNRQIQEKATLMANLHFPWLGMLMSAGVQEINSTEVEQHNYTLRARTVTTSGATNTTGVTVLTLSATPTNLRVGDQVRVDTTQEVMLITAIASNQITVTRGYGGTVKATIPSASVLTVITNAALEGADFSDTGDATPVVKKNFTQIFLEGAKVSGTMQAMEQATNLEGANNQMAKEIVRHLKHQMQDLAGAIMSGVAPASTTQGSATVRRTMNGIIEIVREGSASSLGAIYTNVSGADFNSSDAFRNLNTFLKTMWDAGAKPDLLIVNSRIKKQLGDFIPAAERDGNANSVSTNILEYQSSFGVHRILLDNSVPADKLVAVESDKIKLLAVTNRQFQVIPIAKTGDHVRVQLVGEYTLNVEDGATGAHGVAHSAAA